MRLLNIEECSAEERKIVLDGLYNYNMEQVPATNPENWIPFEYVVRNEDQEIIAGNGYTIFGQLDDFPIGHNRYYLQKRL